MEIEEGVIYITPSIILHMIRKPNTKVVLIFSQNNSWFKNIAKTCLPPSIHRCSVHLRQCTFPGLSTSANIFQIADVALGVVFLLFLLILKLLLRLVPAVVLTLETSEVSAIFVFTSKIKVGIIFYPPKPHRSRGTEIEFWTPCDMLYHR